MGCSGILISMFFFPLIPFHSAALSSFNCFGQNLLQIVAPKKLKKDRKRDFRTLVGSKLNMSQQCALAAKKASSTLSSINRSTASTALPEKKPQMLITMGERGGLAVAEDSTFHLQFAFSKSLLDVNPCCHVKHIPWIMSCLVLCFAVSPRCNPYSRRWHFSSRLK